MRELDPHILNDFSIALRVRPAKIYLSVRGKCYWPSNQLRSVKELRITYRARLESEMSKAMVS